MSLPILKLVGDTVAVARAVAVVDDHEEKGNRMGEAGWSVRSSFWTDHTSSSHPNPNLNLNLDLFEKNRLEVELGKAVQGIRISDYLSKSTF
jgi:hypothetical protein